MVFGETGTLINFVWMVSFELFSGDLGNGVLTQIKHNISSDAGYLTKLREQLQAFYKQHDFEFTDKDCDAVLHGFSSGMYSKDNNVFDSFNLFSKDKASIINIEMLKGKTLTVTVAVRELKDSYAWRKKMVNYKELTLDDLFV